MSYHRFVVLGLLATHCAIAGNPPTQLDFELQQHFGSRPIVLANVNGRPVQLVLHSGASMPVQLDHATAAAAQVKIQAHVDDFGISKPGQLSPLGRDRGTIAKLNLGDYQLLAQPVTIFETPGDDGQGMLGLPWLIANHARLDYAQHSLSISAQATPPEPAQLRGYDGFEMRCGTEPGGRCTVPVTINGEQRSMVVSTVASVVLDKDFASAAKLVFAKQKGNWGSPRGDTGVVWTTSAPICLTIAGSYPATVDNPSIYDLKAYLSDSDARYSGGNGMLGADFLVAHDAIVDFGNAMLYLRHDSRAGNACAAAVQPSPTSATSS